MSKRMRLPNGFGQITELKNQRLRKPFRVMVTVGKDEHGKPICKLLKPQAYFKSYNEAYAALVKYNADPYTLEESITMSELYERWTTELFPKYKSDSSRRTIVSAWNNCQELHEYKVRDIRVRHIKACIDHAKSANMKTRIKSMLNNLLDYAVEYELVDKNYARSFTIDKRIIEEKNQNKKDHMTFTDDEMLILWDNLYVYMYIDYILIQCYTGFRPQELVNLKLSNINLERNIIIGGMKTTAGMNRVVPICKKIKPCVENAYRRAEEKGSEYLVICEDSKDIRMTYDKYNIRFKKIVGALKLDPNHRPHDPRKFFVTTAKRYKVDEYAIKRIVGHAISDITENVYTERDLQWLKDEIRKMDV